MNYRADIVSRLQKNKSSRISYIRAKLSVLIPSQVKALSIKSKKPLNIGIDLGITSTIDSLIEIAAANKVGLVVKFVSFSEMLEWDNAYSQDDFAPVKLDDDEKFLNP